MKKTPALAFVLVTAMSATAFADEAIIVSAPPTRILGLDAAAVVPVGDYADLATLGIGALARLEVPAGQGFITARAGVIFHALRDGIDGSVTFVPLYGGYRMPLGTGGAFVAGELGITLGFASVDTPFGQMSDSDSELGATLMAGMRRGALDLRAGLFSPDLDDAVGLLASAGYDFAAF